MYHFGCWLVCCSLHWIFVNFTSPTCFPNSAPLNNPDLEVSPCWFSNRTPPQTPHCGISLPRLIWKNILLSLTPPMKTSSYFVYSKFITTLTPALKNLPGSVFTSSFSKTSCEFSSLKHEGTDPSYISNCPTYNVFYLSSLSFLKDVSFQNDSNSLLRLSNSDLGGFILLCWYRNSYGQHIWSCWPPYLQVMLLALNYVSIDFETVDNCIQFECLEKSFWITDIALLWLNSFLPDHYYSFVFGHTCSAWSSISLGLVLYYLRPGTLFH